MKFDWQEIKKKMVGERLSPEDIAAGWALGVCIGCAIPFGMQLIISVPLALMARISKVGATVGTLVSNPFSVLLIYPTQTYIVDQLLFSGSLSFTKLMNTRWTWEAVKSLGAEAVASFFIGGVILAAICTPITYFCVKRIVLEHRKRYGLPK